MDRAPEPGNAGERDLLLGWLAFHRDALAAKCEGLTAEQLVESSAPPSDLSLLGLVRHMTEMEHAYLVYAMTGGSFRLRVLHRRGARRGHRRPVRRVMARRVDGSLALTSAPALISYFPQQGSLESISPGNRLSVRWNLIKVIQEYARHNGHADLIRERIDGATGE